MEAFGRGVGGSGEQDPLRGGAGVADGGDGGLRGVGPGVHVEVVGLVHDAEDDVGLGGVLLGELRPHGGEVVVGRAARGLADDLTVPAGVVVDVNNAAGVGGEARFNDAVVAGEIGFIEGSTELVGDKVLPANGEAEDVESVVGGEVLHLGGTDTGGALRATVAITLVLC